MDEARARHVQFPVIPSLVNSIYFAYTDHIWTYYISYLTLEK